MKEAELFKAKWSDVHCMKKTQNYGNLQEYSPTPKLKEFFGIFRSKPDVKSLVLSTKLYQKITDKLDRSSDSLLIKLEVYLEDTHCQTEQ